MKATATLFSLLSMMMASVSASVDEAESIQFLGENVTSPNLKMNILEGMDYHNVPGVSIAVVSWGRIAWAGGYGNITHDQTSRLVDRHTLFQAGSISKPITAFGALLLVQQGKIDLDADVNSYLRSWKVPENEHTQTEKVTLRRLLSHTAGTSVHGFPGYASSSQVPSTIAVLDGIAPLVNTAPVRVVHKPGTKYQYSGGGTTIVQLLIEEITGEPFDAWMQTNVLDPLGMSESTFSQPFSFSHAERAAYGHSKGKKVDGNWHIYPEKAAAGLWTTPTDLAKFLLHIQAALKSENTALLQRSFVKEMLTRQLPGDREDAPGLGFFLNHHGEDLTFAHRGQDEGFIASFFGFAAKDQGFVIMINDEGGVDLMNEIERYFKNFWMQ